MFTVKYKGYFIHCYINKEECTWQDVDGIVRGKARNTTQARRAITKHIKAVDLN